MSELRSSYKKVDITLSLIEELRSRTMTREDIRSFLSGQYRKLGKIPKNCKNPAYYKVCDRTVKREIDAIKDKYGDQLDYNREYGVYKLDLHDFPDTIDETEIQALDVAIQKLGNNLNARKLLEYLKAKLTSRLYRKIERTEPTKAAKRINDIDQTINSNYAFVGPRLIVDFEEKVKATLDSMISKQHEVSFTYYKKTITVQPLGIIYGPNNVYLLAYEYKDEKPSSKPQYYILTEISNVADTGNWFARDESFSLKKYASSMFGIYNDGTVYDVEWLIKKPRIIKVAQQYLFHPTQQFVKNTDGSLTVKMRTGGLRAISVFLAQWGGDIIPVKPAALLTEYENLLKNCYNSIRPEEDLSSK